MTDPVLPTHTSYKMNKQVIWKLFIFSSGIILLFYEPLNTIEWVLNFDHFFLFQSLIRPNE